jgi:hypothetical protein
MRFIVHLLLLTQLIKVLFVLFKVMIIKILITFKGSYKLYNIQTKSESPKNLLFYHFAITFYKTIEVVKQKL